MNRKTLILAALLGTVLIPGPLAAQLPPPELPRSDAGLGLLGYERYLEESLHRGLSAYLGQDRYMVQVKAVLSETVSLPQLMAPAAPTQPMAEIPAPAEPESDQPPVLPGLALEGTRLDTVMPAPQAPARAPVTYAPQPMPALSEAQRKIDRLRVSVMVPRSLSTTDEDFIRNMVMQKVDHQLVRDVSVEISRRDFAAQPLPMAGASGVPGWLLLGLAGLGGLVVGLVASRLRGQAPAPVAAAPVPMSAPAAQPIKVEAPRRSEEDPRHDLTVLLLSEPELAERFISQLLAGEMGIERAAVLSKALGMGVSRRLFANVPDAVWSQIELKQLEKDETSSEETQQAVRDALRTILRDRHQGAATSSRRQSPFAFLETLDDSQILYVLQEESPRVQALVFSQLPPGRAVGLMQLLNPGELGAITAAMGDLSSIPLSAFNDIALHLATKASEAPRFSTAVTNGVDYLVGLLDHSDRVMEQRILQELSTQNPQVLQQVRASYLSFDDIPKLSKDALRDAVRDFPKEQLAEVLRDAPEPVVTALMGALNERGRLIVEEALKGPSLLDVNPAARDAMRRDLVSRIRQISRSSVVPKATGG